MEPGLSSPTAFRHWAERPSGRLTRIGMGANGAIVKVARDETLMAGGEAAISARCYAHQAAEAAIEGGQIVEAGVERDRRDPVFALAEPHRGAMQAGVQDILVRRDAGHAAERVQEV